MEDDPDLDFAMKETVRRLHNVINTAGTSFLGENIEEFMSCVDALIDIKIAIALDMISDRIEAATNVRA